MDHSMVRKLLSNFSSLLQLNIRPLDSRIEPFKNAIASVYGTRLVRMLASATDMSVPPRSIFLPPDLAKDRASTTDN